MSLLESVRDYYELSYHKMKFVLMHYPILEWNGYYKGAIQLHGHQHNHEDYNYNHLKNGILQYDVGVDANRMAPVSIDEIIAFFKLKDT